MTELDTIRAFFALSSKVRRRYLETILALPREEQTKDRGASYPSLLDILAHTIDGTRYWFEFVSQDRATDVDAIMAAELHPSDLSPARWQEELERIDRTVNDYLARLREASLSGEMVCHFPQDGKPVEMRFLIGDVLWHVIEEELQHRGELNALLWQMNVDPPLAKVADWYEAKAAVQPH